MKFRVRWGASCDSSWPETQASVMGFWSHCDSKGKQHYTISDEQIHFVRNVADDHSSDYMYSLVRLTLFEKHQAASMPAWARPERKVFVANSCTEPGLAEDLTQIAAAV